jgi:hypothetical protein
MNLHLCVEERRRFWMTEGAREVVENLKLVKKSWREDQYDDSVGKAKILSAGKNQGSLA